MSSEEKMEETSLRSLVPSEENTEETSLRYSVPSQKIQNRHLLDVQCQVKKHFEIFSTE